MLKNALLAAAISLGLATVGCAAESEPKQPSTTQSASGDSKEDASLAAVLAYADWCSSCKILDPKVKAVKESQELAGVQFVTIDYTDRDVEGLFVQADTNGVGQAVRTFLADEVKTGWLLLVDLDDNKVVGKVVKSMNEDEIAGAIKATQLAS